MTIQYNEPITFGRGGSARLLASRGIDFSEDGDRSWTDAPLVELDIQLPFPTQDIVLEVDAAPFLVPEIVRYQNVFVYLSGFFTYFIQLYGHTTRELPLPRNALTGRRVRLSLVIPTAMSPGVMKMSDDERALGICLERMVFKTVD